MIGAYRTRKASLERQLAAVEARPTMAESGAIADRRRADAAEEMLRQADNDRTVRIAAISGVGTSAVE